MKSRIRKLNISENGIFDQIEDVYISNIMIEELNAVRENKSNTEYTVYGIFNRDNELIGCCGIGKDEGYASYEYWTNTSKSITEITINDKYKNDISLYCDLLDYVLTDNGNLECNVFFDNSIDLEEEYYKQLGFISLPDGVLVRLAINYNFEEEI